MSMGDLVRQDLPWWDLAPELSPYATALDRAVRRLEIAEYAIGGRGPRDGIRESATLTGWDFGVKPAAVRRLCARVWSLPVRDWLPVLLADEPPAYISGEERRLTAALYAQRFQGGRRPGVGDARAAEVFACFSVSASVIGRARRSLVFWPSEDRLWSALGRKTEPAPYGLRKEIEAFGLYIRHDTEPEIASRALGRLHGVAAPPDLVRQWTGQIQAVCP